MIIGKMIYNYLLYKAYRLARLAKNEDDDAIWWGTMIVISCLIFNISAFIFLLDGIGFIKYSGSGSKYFIGAIMTLGVVGYYLYKGRYKKIIMYYQGREKDKRSVHPLIVVLSYCIVSIFLMILAAMYKNGSGIFA